MINANMQVHHAAIQDHDQIAALAFHEFNCHRHLDWHSPLEWIGSSNYWKLEEGNKTLGALACPEDPPQVAWIRFFAYHPNLSESQAWHFLWAEARRELTRANIQTTIAAIVVKKWFQTILLSSGFKLKQNIILLDLTIDKIKYFSTPSAIRIRPMQSADMPAVTALDLAAFGNFWHNTMGTLQRARAQCFSATVAEDDSGLIGYQLSTRNLLGAHLARLAVRPDAQGRGVASALVSQLIHSFESNQFSKLSVNTQDDNITSLSLYKKLGFVRSGESFPVLVYPIGV